MFVNPHVHLISRGYLLGISRLKGGSFGGGRVKQLGYHRKGTTIFPLFQNILNAMAFG